MHRVAAFVAALIFVFGAAFAAGDVVGPDRSGRDAMAAHGAQEVRGLSVSEHGLTLELDDSPGELAFRILDEDGEPLREYPIEHERRMHTIVVRRDLTGFQHVHPELGADGVWRVPLALREAGAYRVFADFVHGDEPRTLAADLTVDGVADYAPLPEPAATASAGGSYAVALDPGEPRAGDASDLSFRVTRDGEPVTTEPYLGAAGHLVALREGDLAFLHVHPEEGGDVRFETTFPTAGRYRLFLQFRHDGEVRTAAFTQAVSR